MSSSSALQMAEIFDLAQKRLNQKNINNMQKLLTKSDKMDDFADDFLRLLSLFMPAKSKTTDVRRLIKFVSDFIESIDAEEYYSFTDTVLNALVFGASAKEKQVRVHCISLAVSILKYLKSLDPIIYEQIKVKFMKGLNDNEAMVRTSAVEGCCVLMKADDADNFMELLLDVIQKDPSAEVRKKLVEELPLNEVTMPFIFGRIRDIDEQVRKAVLRKTADSVSDFQQIPQEWRVKLLTSGFLDRSKQVYKEAELLLINKWLPSVELNFLRFVLETGLDNITVLKRILNCVLNTFQDTKFVFDDEFWFNITLESILMLESYLSILQDKNEDVTECLPQLTTFLDILQEYIKTYFKQESQENALVMNGLLLIHRFYDNGDVYGVNKLYGLARQVLLLPKCPAELIDALLSILRFSTDSVQEYSSCLIELFNTIKDNSGQVEINKRFSLSFSEDAEIDPKYQPGVMTKGLKILGAIFASDTKKIKDWFDINHLMGTILLPYLDQPLLAPKIEALNCLGILSIAYEEMAVQNIAGIAELIFKAPLPLRTLSLQLIMDILYFYKPEKFKDLECCELLISCLNTRKDELLSLAVEGIVKLLISKRIESASLVENLLILYFHPRTNTVPRVRQCLAYFFNGWTTNEPKHVEMISSLLLQVLMKLFQISLQHEMMTNPLDIAMQMIDWIDPRKSFNSESDFDQGFQVNLVKKLLKNCFSYTAVQVKYCASILSKFYIEKAGDERIATNAVYVEYLMQHVDENAIITTLKRYKTNSMKLTSKGYQLSESVRESIEKDVNKMLVGDEHMIEFGTPSKSMIE